MYEFLTEPREFQREVVGATWGLPAFALWWEQGLGKSKALIDTSGMLYDDGQIDAHLLIAPKGLHRNYITRELPKHLHPNYAGPTFFWNQDNVARKWWLNAARAFLDDDRPGLKTLGMSYDGALTEVGQRLIAAFLERSKRGVMLSADESGRLKNPDAARTKELLRVSVDPKIRARRIATGTPVANAPWDVWSQIKFIDPDFWRPHGLGSIEAMKATFGEWDRMAKKIPIAQGKSMEKKLNKYYNFAHIPESQRTLFQHLGGTSIMLVPKIKKTDSGRPQYKNLSQLRGILEPMRSRLLKSDVLKDLPPKTYQTVEFEMTSAQKRAYASLAQLGFAMIDGGQCTSNGALTLMLRLQQIACGYLVLDLDHTRPDEEPEVAPFEPNPRVELLGEIADGIDHQALVWCRFRADVEQITQKLAHVGKTFVRYDGTLTEDEAEHNENEFHKGNAQFFVSTQSKGGEGLTLIEAKTAIYFSNTFKLTERLQSEDRPHRIGQKNAVNNIDIVARGTIDEHLLESHLAKFEMASNVNGDRLRPWIVPPGELF